MPATQSPFKNSNGQLYTKRLFYETTTLINDRSSAIYTLKDQDHHADGRVYTSLYQAYLDMEDLTEYRFANRFFDSYEHLRLLNQAEWFSEHITRWRRELRLKLQSRAYDALLGLMKDGTSRNSFEATKLVLALLDPTEKARRGRPDKHEINKVVKEIAREEQSLADDHSRVFA